MSVTTNLIGEIQELERIARTEIINFDPLQSLFQQRRIIADSLLRNGDSSDKALFTTLQHINIQIKNYLCLNL